MEPQQPTSSQPPDPIPPAEPAHHTPLKIILIAIGILLAGAILVFVYQTIQANRSWRFTEPPDMMGSINQVSPSPILDETAEWKTYTNTNSISGFQIDIPSIWKELEHSSSFENSSMFQAPDGSQIDLTVEQTTFNDLDSYLSDLDKTNTTAWEGKPSKTIKQTQLITIGNAKGIIRVEDWLAAGFTTKVTYIINDNKVFSITLLPYGDGNFETQEAAKKYDHILSTFTFLE
ncbi:MAG: hypothetical protein UU81_C0010G0054 [Microgenomates group bacterium GW2011_GWC1_41_8]|uniref:PsbP C-terminal domain-containing protein n=3 Tax=Candidatus Roizmaniibacteriota TaxID=1752723 RepID=A0A0G0XFF3_9BACT|nr:MAG: hypothetical protein UU14_C0003G0071 [Candidatus Roizmanbacteria bacterium GW2011_GWB1_40_7]KKR94583.1 MAG: hypothetical protein UU41_C0005G0041 [Candidatus Roizmanbacteria bacterium GW2011_GWA1_41_13]KKS23157.1 MAG: hypothetical protein UU78_C0002G0010 [Candidatus Roizmanbacteria bacterium GW2011_GWC2_41_7]KKS24271.1 MAG: hypothetical protein UU81_C0010G0054 [Microgenomates group bacterium GW2011_GWC1_41_8]OGK48398.1 MAG: hypothetical protein A3A55_04220 [Candidatus Roizmanbacteria bac